MHQRLITCSAATTGIRSGRTAVHLLLLIGFIVALSACAGKVIRPIKESSRDTTGNYDGRWNGIVVHTPTPQRFGNWTMKCSDPQTDFDILVKNGQVTTRRNGQGYVAYIDSDGRFRISIPTGSRASASLASDLQINSDITLFLEGSLGLEKPVGRFVIGVAEFGGNGCTSTLSYEKI